MSVFLLGHATTPDKLKLITSAAGDIDTVCSYIDYDDANPPVVQDMNVEKHNIVTAATTDILAGVTSANQRRVLKNCAIVNTHASVANNVTVVLDAIDGLDYSITATYVLQPLESLRYDEGHGWFKDSSPTLALAGATNKMLGANQSGFAVDTYLQNSSLVCAALGPATIGRTFHWRFILSKTAAGTATPIITVRTGTGVVGDASRVVFTWGAGTAAIDRVEVEMDVFFISVGAGTAAVLRGKANATSNLTTTGWSNAVKALQPADSGGFDSTTAGLVVGLSYNGGASAVHDLEDMRAYTDQL